MIDYILENNYVEQIRKFYNLVIVEVRSLDIIDQLTFGCAWYEKDQKR